MINKKIIRILDRIFVADLYTRKIKGNDKNNIDANKFLFPIVAEIFSTEIMKSLSFAQEV